MGILSNFFGALDGLCIIAKSLLRKGVVIIKGLLGEVFKRAQDMMNNVIDRLEQKIEGEIEGASHFFRQVGDLFQEGTKNYFLDTELGEWHETVVTRTVESSAIPEAYLTQLNDENEYNDTLELQNALSC